jgi:hypothetical protein
VVSEPIVEEWSVFPTQVMEGETVTITWRVRNADSVTLEPLGPVGPAGSREDKPQPPTRTYLLIASYQGNTVRRSQEVLVNQAPPGAPVIRAFAAQPSSMVAGQVTTVRLTWATDNAESVSITPGIGPVEATGSRDLPAPASTTVYILTAENATGSVTGQARIEVIFPSPTPTLPPEPTPTMLVVIPTDTPEPTPTLPPPPTPTVTPTACPGPPVIASFAATPSTIAAGGSATLSWGAVTNATSVVIDNGLGPVAAPGSAPVSPGSTTTYRMTATGCGGATTMETTVTVVVVPVPAQQSPADGTVLRVYPRVATFTWSPVNVPGGVTYGIEIQIDTGFWQTAASASGLAGTTYNMPAFAGDNPGRWRVWATSPTYGASQSSPWWTFKFNTTAAQYSATWVNDDPNTGGITKIIITNAGQTLNIHPYGKCHPTDCDWGTKSVTPFPPGEPIKVDFPGHSLSITLNDAAGAKLKVVDSGSTGTSYFHRS